MSTYRIVIDQSLCSGFGSCVDSLPGAIRLEGGTARPVVAEVTDPAALEAAASCPMGAVAVVDAVTGVQVA
jgi:ferredoxin